MTPHRCIEVDGGLQRFDSKLGFGNNPLAHTYNTYNAYIIDKYCPRFASCLLFFVRLS